MKVKRKNVKALHLAQFKPLNVIITSFDSLIEGSSKRTCLISKLETRKGYFLSRFQQLKLKQLLSTLSQLNLREHLSFFSLLISSLRANKSETIRDFCDCETKKFPNRNRESLDLKRNVSMQIFFVFGSCLARPLDRS